MNDLGFLVGPYFITLALIAAILALITIWSGRKTWIRVLAVLLSCGVVYLSYIVIDDLLSRPKPMTYAELQSEIPDGHPGHIVLYGERTEGGIYLLLRSPSHKEPRYYLLSADEAMQKNFQKAQGEARKKGTQLLLGGRSKKGKPDGKDPGGKDRGDGSPDAPFHPAPVSGGPEKQMTPESPVSLPTPYYDEYGP